jgi:hypothetical protein
LQKYTRASDPSILHAYDAVPAIWSRCPIQLAKGQRPSWKTWASRAGQQNSFVAEFIKEKFINQIIDERLLKQLYPGGVLAR